MSKAFFLTVAFFLGFVPTLLAPAFSWPHLFFFSPFLAIAMNRTAWLTSLWLALLAGFCTDMSSSAPFGFHSLSYTLTVALLYSQRHRFLPDHLAAIPVYSFCISSVTTLLQALLMAFFDKPIALSWAWVGTDLVCMPLLDALYGVFGYLPILSLLPRGPKRAPLPRFRRPK